MDYSINEPMEEKAPVGITRKGIIRILRAVVSALAVVFLIAISIFAYNFYKLSPQRIFNNYYKTYEFSIPGTGSVFEKLYDEKKYERVTRTSKGDALTAKDNFIKALCWLELRNAELSIPYFKRVLEHDAATNASEWKEESEYYLSLAYILNKDYDLALPLLRKIYDEAGHKYNPRVTSRLIRKVKLLKWR
jgi:hypothetical protein